MASIHTRRRRKGAVYIVMWRDSSGRQRSQTFTTRDEAVRFRGRKEVEGGQARAAPPTELMNMTVGTYADRWMQQASLGLKPATIEAYEKMLRLHVKPAIGRLGLRRVQSAHIMEMFTGLAHAGYSFRTMRLVMAPTKQLFSGAIFDGVLASNPCEGVWRRLRLARREAREEVDEADRVRPFTDSQLDRLFAAADAVEPWSTDLWFLMARTGLRIGEACGLRWDGDDIDLNARVINVRRTVASKTKQRATIDERVGSPKSGKSRAVDMSTDLRARLVLRRKLHREASLRAGEPASPWVFGDRPGLGAAPLSSNDLRRSFSRVLRAAGLEGHTPHDLRHTFATWLLEDNVSLLYVSAQLGHASIEITAKVYAHWIPKGDRSFVDALDRRGTHARIAINAPELNPGAVDQKQRFVDQNDLPTTLPTPQVVAASRVPGSVSCDAFVTHI